MSKLTNQAQTIGQYKALHFVEQNFAPDAQLYYELLDRNTIRIRDMNNDTILFQYQSDGRIVAQDDE